MSSALIIDTVKKIQSISSIQKANLRFLVMTECFSGFKHIGHAEWLPLLSSWGVHEVGYIIIMIPENLLNFSCSFLYGFIFAHMIPSIGSDITQGLLYLEESTSGKEGRKKEKLGILKYY